MENIYNRIKESGRKYNMDYSIAVIAPSRPVCETVRKTLKTLDLEFPVYTASTHEAVEIARSLIPKGLRIVISHGVTAPHIANALPVSVMWLPFSGLETLKTIRRAIGSGSKRIVHVGTKEMYHYIQKSLMYMGLEPDLIYFCELSMERTPLDHAIDMVNAGFEVFIGGYTVVKYIESIGRIGLEFDTDEYIVSSAIRNAQHSLEYLLRQERQHELDRAILQSSTDGIIAIDSERKIFQINPAAAHIFSKKPEELISEDFDGLLTKTHVMDIRSSDASFDPQLNDSTLVLMQEIPVEAHGSRQASVINIKKLSEIRELDQQVQKSLVEKGLFAKNTFNNIVGECPAIEQAKSRALTYSRYDSTVLLYGETGTGKELFAQSIHNASRRRRQPFVAINCASLPENLIESELFGYVKGAFTGAVKEGKQGLFELANHGTIFLDEISELPIAVQSKLLRVIQDGEFLRVGGDQVIKVDVRIISSSNKNLLTLIRNGSFKNDLYYRLSVLEVYIPPLRERKGDIELLAFNLMYRHADRHHKLVNRINPEVIERLKVMNFYGNVRELSNIMERMVILADTTEINMETFNKSDIRDYGTDAFGDGAFGDGAFEHQFYGYGNYGYDNYARDSRTREYYKAAEDPAGRKASYVSDNAAPRFADHAVRESADIITDASSKQSPVQYSGEAGIHVQSGTEEIREVIEALEKCHGSRTEAAKLLGVNPSTLWRRMKKYNISVD